MTSSSVEWNQAPHGKQAIEHNTAAGPAMPRGRGMSRSHSPLMLAGLLLLAGFAGLAWVAITSTDPDAYIRTVSGWLLFP